MTEGVQGTKGFIRSGTLARTLEQAFLNVRGETNSWTAITYIALNDAGIRQQNGNVIAAAPPTQANNTKAAILNAVRAADALGEIPTYYQIQWYILTATAAGINGTYVNAATAKANCTGGGYAWMPTDFDDIVKLDF